MKQICIPAPVVKFLMTFGEEDVAEALSYFFKSMDGDNYFFTDYLVEIGIVSEKLGDELFAVCNKLKYEDVFEWYAALKEDSQ